MTRSSLPMEILVSTGSLPWLPLSARLQLIREAGADGAELLLQRRPREREAETIREISRESGLPVRSLHSLLRLRSVSPDIQAVDVESSARLAAELPRCSILVVHPPIGAEREQWTTVMRRIERSRPEHLRIGLETPGQHRRGQRPAPFDNLEFLVRYAEEWDLGIVFDTAHAASLGWDLQAALALCLPRLVNVHLSDASDREWWIGFLNSIVRDHRCPGDGTLPLRQLLQFLRDQGYRGFVTLELSPLALFSLRRGSIVRLLQKAIAFVCEAIGEPAPGRSSPGREPPTRRR